MIFVAKRLIIKLEEYNLFDEKNEIENIEIKVYNNLVYYLFNNSWRYYSWVFEIWKENIYFDNLD